MKILIFGMGGIGGFVGGALAGVCPDVYFYGRGENLKAIEREGLRVDSEILGSLTVRPKKTVRKGEKTEMMDVIFFACKGNALKEACQEAAPFIRKDTLVIPLLNGVLISDMMKPLLPPCLLADGTIRVFSHLSGPGHVVQTAGSGQIRMGMKDGETPHRLYETASLLRKAGIPAEVTEEIRTDSWAKYAIMGSNSAVFCYFDRPAGAVRKEDGFLSVVREAVREVIRAAASEGVFLPKSCEEGYVAAFLSLPEETVTSLYRDLKSGKKAEDTEAEMILGRMVKIGKERGLDIPVFQKAWEWARCQ